MTTSSAGQDKRAELDSMMNYIRLMAGTGVGVIGVSAVARQKERSGSSYNGIGLASFRGSSELEYGADSAWALEADTDDFGATNFVCHKNRHGDTPKLMLTFDKLRQSFSVIAPGKFKANHKRAASAERTEKVYSEEDYDDDNVF